MLVGKYTGFVKRYLKSQILTDLDRKMVFLAGPRQCGKTTLAKDLMPKSTHYMNWDIPEDREVILQRDFQNKNLFVFDEIHKFKRWRNYLKGLYDKIGPKQKILVTGSAKLDHYRFGGDSLQGRYHFLRLFPLSFCEIQGKTHKDLLELFKLGPFPEPFLGGSKTEADRWSLLYRSRVIRDEIPTLENVKEIDLLDLLARALPERVGSPLSINNLREDLEVSFRAVKAWLLIFEKLYVLFRLKPFGSPLLKAVKLEQKHYHFDWNLVKEDGPRFENMIAYHLLKWVHYQQDCFGKDLNFCFMRDVEGREVDFVVADGRKPLLFVETKLSDTTVAPALNFIKKKFPNSRVLQVLLKDGVHKKNEYGVELISAHTFLNELI